MRADPEAAQLKSTGKVLAAVVVFMGILTFLSGGVLISMQPLEPQVVKAIFKYIWLLLGTGLLFAIISNRLLNRKALEPEDEDI